MKSSCSTGLGIIILTFVLIMVDFAAAAGADSAAGTSVRVAESPDTPDASENIEKTHEAVRGVPVYVPPRRGQPRARVGGGVRGIAAKLPTLQALVPDHVALTAKPQPTLLWHLDQLPPDRASLMFSLTSEEQIDPLIAVVLERPTQAGLQRIDLSQYAFQLEKSQEYQWSVALVTDFDHRSRDLIIFGWIERVEESREAETQQPSPSQSDLTEISNVAALAAAGLWYDAIDAANGTELATLLQQIGLAADDSR